MKPLFPTLLASALALAAPACLAHNAFVECEAIDDGRIRCTGGLSDGSAAPGVTLDVIGYDERVLVNGQLGDDSRFTFPRPNGEFYVLLDLGAGHTAELDYKQIKGL